jgi:hypothetical protein
VTTKEPVGSGSSTYKGTGTGTGTYKGTGSSTYKGTGSGSGGSERSADTWKNHKALEALRAPKLAPMVQQFFDGKAGADALAGAVAAFHRDGGRWEDWREPTVRALTALDETRGR